MCRVARGPPAATARLAHVPTVASAGSNAQSQPGFASPAFVVRKDHLDSGRVRDFADLPGLRIATPSLPSALGPSLFRILERAGSPRPMSRPRRWPPPT